MVNFTAKTLRRKSSNPRGEERSEERNRAQILPRPSKLKLEKPQCFAKSHIQLLVSKKVVGDALSVPQCGDGSPGWPGERALGSRAGP